MTAEEIERLRGLYDAVSLAFVGLSRKESKVAVADLIRSYPALLDEVERLRGVMAQLLDVLRKAFVDTEDAVALERDIDRGLEIARAALGMSE